MRQLIYYINIKKGLRFYIFKIIIKDIFRLVYNKSGYFKYNKTHEKLFKGLYIYNIAKELRVYIKYYLKC